MSDYEQCLVCGATLETREITQARQALVDVCLKYQDALDALYADPEDRRDAEKYQNVNVVYADLLNQITTYREALEPTP